MIARFSGRKSVDVGSTVAVVSVFRPCVISVSGDEINSPSFRQDR